MIKSAYDVSSTVAESWITFLWRWASQSHEMMTSSNGNIFRVTGPLCGEFTGPGEFPTQRPVTRNFDVFFDLRPNKQLSKQPWGWWFETPSWSLCRQCNEMSQVRRRIYIYIYIYIYIAFGIFDYLFKATMTGNSNVVEYFHVCVSTSKSRGSVRGGGH